MLKIMGLKKQLVLSCILIFLGITIAAWQFGIGVFIYAKAYFAKGLIAHAWQQSVATGKPHKPWPWADTYPVARLRVPSLGIEQIVLSGASGRTLAFGPGFMLASTAFDEVGASVIGGHRDTHFKFLQHLQLGDDIYIELANGQSKLFKVSNLEIADVRSSQLRLDNTEPVLMLITCYPFNVIARTGNLRYVVTAM